MAFKLVYNACTQMAICVFETKKKNLEKRKILLLYLVFQKNLKLNFYLFILFFAFKVTLKIEI